MVRSRGFQLVSAIRRLEEDRRIEATTAWNDADRLRPICFLIEAVAQAAGWLIAASTGFVRRGLPLSIGTVRIQEEPRAGVPLDLVAEVTAWRDSSTVLRGHASSEGRVLGTAEAGISGLLPADQLDDPAATRATYATLLRAPQGPNGSQAGAEPPGLPRIDVLEAQRARATWEVRGGVELFADHFPRMPVLPGTYQLQALLDLAGAVIGATNGRPKTPVLLRQIRFRRAVRPGDRLTLEVETVERAAHRIVLTGLARVGDERAASIGEMEFRPAAA